LIWSCADAELDLAVRTHVMGILNVTPDSFSDGGLYIDPGQAIQRGLQMAAEGADIIDVGGESTRPGSEPVSAEKEIKRVLPVIEGLASQCGCLISIDSSKAKVAEEALQAGARIVNDISGMTFDPEMARLVSRTRAGVVLMHIKGVPRNMQRNPHYEDVTAEICAVLRDHIEEAVQAGVAPQRIVIDPGIGFGKRVTDNLTLIRELGRLGSLGRPILVGPSRKSFIGEVLDLPADQRLEGTLAAVAVSVINGARIVRVHDVKAVRRAVDTVDAILNAAFGPDS